MSERQPIDLDDLQRVGVLVREKTADNWLADMVEIAAAEIARLREALKVINACFSEMVTRLEEQLLPGPPGPEPVAWRYKGEPWC